MALSREWEQTKKTSVPKADQEYARYIQNQATVRALARKLRNPDAWRGRLALESPSIDASKVYREITATHDKLSKEAQKIAERHKHLRTSDKATRDAVRITKGRVGTGFHAVDSGVSDFKIKIPSPGEILRFAPSIPACSYISGRVGNPTMLMGTTSTPDDDDSTFLQAIEPSTSPDWDGVYHNARIHDETHFYSHDESESLCYWVAFGYELPEAPCNGSMHWDCYLEHRLSLGGNAEDHELWWDWMEYPNLLSGDGNWPGGEPGSAGDFFKTTWRPPEPHYASGETSEVWYDYFGTILYNFPSAEGPGYYAGSTRVTAGQVVKPWIGFMVELVTREGTGSTGRGSVGWNCLAIVSDWEFNFQSDMYGQGWAWVPLQPGMNYSFVPD